MLKTEGKSRKDGSEVAEGYSSEGDGLLFLGVLTASWAVAIGFGWIVWRLTPL
jgi:hypothetical protein